MLSLEVFWAIVVVIVLVPLIKRSSNMSEENKIAPTAEDGVVKCPECGSTQIQIVNRKWSLLTGFLTNKVDRVCVRCKNRF
jgi:hypothetical protein